MVSGRKIMTRPAVWCIQGHDTADLNILGGINCSPGVRSQSLRRVWTQTGDGHDADA